MGGYISRALGPRHPDVPAFIDIGQRFDVGGDSTSAVEESSNLEGLVLLGWNAYQFNTPKLDFSTTLELFPSLSEAGRVRGSSTFESSTSSSRTSTSGSS